MEMKEYKTPEMEVVELKSQSPLLVESEGIGKNDEEVDY